MHWMYCSILVTRTKRRLYKFQYHRSPSSSIRRCFDGPVLAKKSLLRAVSIAGKLKYRLWKGQSTNWLCSVKCLVLDTWCHMIAFVLSVSSLQTVGLVCVWSQEEFYTVVEVPEGTHQYKYHIDGDWVCHPNEVCLPAQCSSAVCVCCDNQLSIAASEPVRI